MKIDKVALIQDLIIGRQVLKANFAGEKLAILCPFHEEKTPSMTIDYVRNKFACLGCNKHGTLIELYDHVRGEDTYATTGEMQFEAQRLANAPRPVVTDIDAEIEKAKSLPVPPPNPKAQNYVRPKVEESPINARAKAAMARKKK
jgi:hypothetical protein